MKIVIIDDEEISIYLTKHALKEAGFTGTIASFLSAEAALEILIQDISDQVPQVILLDLNMPSMNGWDFLYELTPYIEQLLGWCHIFILTSSLAISDIEKSKEKRLVYGFISKPISQEDIELILQMNE